MTYFNLAISALAVIVVGLLITLMYKLWGKNEP